MTNDPRSSAADDKSADETEYQEQQRTGFLPMRTNLWDRCFISIIVYVAISLLWMRYFESFASIHISTLISALLAVVIIRKG